MGSTAAGRSRDSNRAVVAWWHAPAVIRAPGGQAMSPAAAITGSEREAWTGGEAGVEAAVEAAVETAGALVAGVEPLPHPASATAAREARTAGCTERC